MDAQLKKEILMAARERITRVQSEQSIQRQEEGRYVYEYTTAEQRKLGVLQQKSSLTRKNVGDVREIVSEVMPHAFDKIDDILEATGVDKRAVEVHHSRGKRFVENGAKVLEFDIAGSGFKQFRAIHRGFHGKYIVNERGEKEKFKKKLKVTWFNKAFSWLPKVRSVKQVEEENARRERMTRELIQKYNMEGNIDDIKEANRRLKEHHKRLIEEHYGQQQYIGHKRMEHIRKKVTDDARKTRITMAGPLAIKGASNSGEYSIEKLRQYILTMGSDYLRGVFDGWRGPEDVHDVNLIMRGHSRGGVAVAEGAMLIKQWVSEHYPQYITRVKFDLIQYDPVPGFGSYSKHKMIDHNGEEIIEKDGLKMKPLGENAETTVMYSMHTDHPVFFTPQVIKGAKRVILTPFKHGVDLGAADRTQIQAHRRGLVDANSGEVYRSSGINDLASGVYVVDEQNTLVKINNYEQVERILNTFVKDTSSQKERHKIMLDVARTWFENHREAPAI